MNTGDIRIYNPELEIDGTLNELIDWSYRYDGDYTDEALTEIHKQALALGMPEEKASIPLLVRDGRHREERKDGTLPYEQMKLDKLIYEKISFSETKEYGEVEIWEEQDNILISITGTDNIGNFSAAAIIPVTNFMKNDGDWLESIIGCVLAYNKQYEE